MVIEIVRAVHIGAGVVALLAFPVPLVAAKGGRLHRRAGRVYVTAAAVIAATAIVACTHRLLFGGGPGGLDGTLLLGFLALLAANAARTGLRVLRLKERRAPHDLKRDLALPAVLLVLSAALGTSGFLRHVPLHAAFGIVGMIISLRHLRYWRSTPSTPLHWKYQHMQSMVGSTIATLTAFLVVNARAFGLEGSWLTAAWLAPTLVGLPGVAIWIARLRRRETPARAAHA